MNDAEDSSTLANLRQLVGPHLVARHVHRGVHGNQVDGGLTEEAHADGWVEERAEGPFRVHLVDGGGVREGERCD